jgi:hypothetical protein
MQSADTKPPVLPSHRSTPVPTITPARPCRFGNTYVGKYSNSLPPELDITHFYESHNMYDDLSFAASWLYKATEEASYLTDAATYLAKHYGEEAPYPWHNSGWDTNSWAAALMLAKSPATQPSYVARIQVRCALQSHAAATASRATTASS